MGREEGSKFGHNCQWIVLKNADMEEGGVKNPEKLPMLFMGSPKHQSSHTPSRHISLS